MRLAHPRWAAAITSLALAGLTLGACNSSPSAESGVIRALGAENQYANVIAQIGGRYVEATAVMSNPNTDPHTFEVSTNVARAVAQARLVVQNGVGYDTFMSQLESASPDSSRHVLDVQHLLGLPTATKNPHLWYDPAVMARVARAIDAELASIQPRHRAYFAARTRRFLAALAPVDAAATAARHRDGGVEVVVTEPVADYLLSDMGITVATPWTFQADIMNGVDPSPEDLTLQDSLLAHHRVKVLCYNAQVSSPVTVALRARAVAAGVPVVAVYETMPTGYDYQRWMLAEIHAIDEAITTGRSTESL